LSFRGGEGRGGEGMGREVGGLELENKSIDNPDTKAKLKASTPSTTFLLTTKPTHP